MEMRRNALSLEPLTDRSTVRRESVAEKLQRSLDGDPAPGKSDGPKGAFKLTVRELISEMWKKQIPRTGIENSDRMRLQKAYDDDFKMVTRKQMREGLSDRQLGWQRPSTAAAHRAGPLSVQGNHPSDPAGRNLSVRGVVALPPVRLVERKLGELNLRPSGELERDVRVLQCLYDVGVGADVSAAAASAEVASRRRKCSILQSPAMAMDPLVALAPANSMTKMTAADIYRELEVRQLEVADETANRSTLLAVLEREYACALEGWVHAQALSVGALHRQMKERGLLPTGFRDMDAVNLQSALDQEFKERHLRHQALVANLLVPLDAFELSKDSLYAEMEARALEPTESFDGDAQRLQLALDAEYLTFLKARVRHQLPTVIKITCHRRRASMAHAHQRLGPSLAQATAQQEPALLPDSSCATKRGSVSARVPTAMAMRRRDVARKASVVKVTHLPLPEDGTPREKMRFVDVG